MRKGGGFSLGGAWENRGVGGDAKGTENAEDWKKIETDYMGGNLSYAKIAEKWGVSVRQVEEHGRKNHWTEKRRNFAGK